MKSHGKPIDGSSASRGEELRRLAEEQVRAREQSDAPRTDAQQTETDTARINHELQIHQIELEMQNEELRRAKDEVSRLLDQYSDLYDFAPAGYVTLDCDGTIRRISLTMASLLGVERAQLMERRFIQFLAESDRRAFSDFLQHVFAGEFGESREVVLPGTGGTPIPMMVRAKLSASGEECNVVALDISERIRMEREQKLAMQVLAMLNRGNNTTIMVKEILLLIKESTGIEAVGIRLRDGDDYPYYESNGLPGHFVDAERHLCLRNAAGELIRDTDGNPVLECMCGNVISGRIDPSKPFFTPKGSFWTNCTTDLLGATSEEDRQSHTRNRCNREGYESVALIPLRSGDEVIGLLQLNDHRREMFTLVMIQFLEELGASIGIALSRKRAEEEIRSAARFPAENPDPILRIAGDGTLLFANDAALRNLAEWHLECDQPAPAELMELTCRDADPEDRQEIEIECGGRAYLFFCVDIRGEGYTNLYGRDITERNRVAKEHEELQAQLVQTQKLDSVGRLAGGIAHDFNNMLTGIMNYADLCSSKIEPDHPICEWLDEIIIEAKRSAKLTQQLLAFARKQVIAPKVLDINDAVEEMLKLLQRLIGEDIAVDLRLEPRTWPVKMDRSQIEQILANLTVNAREAISGVGSICIETANVTVDEDDCADHPEMLPGDYALLTCTDSGCGMDEETVNNIFEPFFTTKGDRGGTGLGLSTVYGIIKQNNGLIDVCSEPGRGTAFKIYLPRFVGSETAPAVHARPTVPLRGTETVLLVEDEKSVRVTTRRFLENLGYTMLVAENPQEALQLSAEQLDTVDLLITDVVMPGMNGSDLAARLKELRPSIKCLFISGFTKDIIAQRGILDDGVNFMSKPFDRNQLACKVREVLKT